MASIDYDALFSAHHEYLWGLCYRVTGSAVDAPKTSCRRPSRGRSLGLHPIPIVPGDRGWLGSRRVWRIDARCGGVECDATSAPGSPRPSRPPPGATAGELASPELDVELRYGLRESVSFAFLRALEALEPVPRATVVLRDVLGYSGPEAAELLGLSAGNVRVILHRARAALVRYDQRRQPPSPEVDRRHQQALQRLMAAWLSGDAERLTECVTEDVRVSSDGAGRLPRRDQAHRGPQLGRSLFAGAAAAVGGHAS